LYQRRNSTKIMVGKVEIGGGAPISVQSMANTDTRNVDETVKQILRLEKAGCELVRVAVIDEEAACSLKTIKQRINIPLIADIHFNYRLALSAVQNGVDGLRLNPGNISSREKVREVVAAAKYNGIPIRIGVNAGSIHQSLLEKYGSIVPEALVESALKHISILEELDFHNMKISLKASRIPLMLDAYRLISPKIIYPLHIGVTEAGTIKGGTIKSAVGIGALLAEGIGDTIRVSLTGDPVQEVHVGFAILNSLDLRKKGIEIISCPTCGRCQINLATLAEKIEAEFAFVEKPLKIAVMGCVVNGPGEAKEADIGIAGGKGQGILFKKGKIVATLPEEKLEDVLFTEIKKMI